MKRAEPESPISALRSSKRHLVRRYLERLLVRPWSSDERAWRYSSRGRSNLARLASIRNRLTGQRCFIVGNGPSLKRTDLLRLRDEWVFGLNRVYLHPAAASWRRWLYCCVNPNVLEQYGSEIAGIDAIKFLPWEHRQLIDNAPGVHWLRTSHEPRFSYDLTEGIWQGATVTYVAMQVAFYLGFRDVILVGVDHAFASGGAPNTLVRAEGDDENHFCPEYFASGAKWQLPDLEQSETAYRLARQAFEQEGRRIRNATVGGKLEVFPRVRFEDVF